MNAIIYKKKGPLVLFLVPTFLFLTMYLYYPFLMNIYNSLNKIGGLGRIRYITLPLLHNTLCTCLVLAITGSLKVFDLPWTMFVGGLPLDKSWLTGTYMYYQTMVLQDVDYGSAIAILIVVLGVVISQIANRIFKEKDY